MNYVILGLSEFGVHLTSLLSREGRHNITVIDRQSQRFEALEPGFNGATYIGHGIDVDVLRDAGCSDAEYFIACTNHDTTNLMAAQLAHKICGTKRAIALVSFVSDEAEQAAFAVSLYCPWDVSAKKLVGEILQAGPDVSSGRSEGTR